MKIKLNYNTVINFYTFTIFCINSMYNGKPGRFNMNLYVKFCKYLHNNCFRTNIYYYLLHNSHSGWLAGAKHFHPTISLSVQNWTAFRSRFKACSNVDVFLSRRTHDDKIWTHTLSNQVI